MANPQRDKGTRVERELAKLLTDVGIPTRRVIGSGAHGGIDSRLKGDLQIGTHGPHGAEWLLTGEVKARKNGEGFTTIERWLGDNDLLLLKRNNRDPLAVLPWSTLVPLLQAFYEDELGVSVNEEVIHGDNFDGSGDVPSDERLHGGSE